jgi:hypothetical protein
MKRSRLFCAGALLLAAPALADELHRQNPINSFSGLSAQDARNTGGLGWMYETLDNFDAQAGWTVTGIEFWGGYPRVQPGNMHGFMIRFYQDNSGAVSDLLLTQDVMTFTEEVYYCCLYPPPIDFPGYHYTLTLDTPFHAHVPGRYWMSVTAILDYGGGADSVQWGWIQAQSINAPDCQQSLSPPGGYSPQGQDVAFVLIGTTGAPGCGSADFDCDGDVGTDADIEAFFACLGGNCPAPPCTSNADFNGDGDVGTDADIEAFFRVLGGGTC